MNKKQKTRNLQHESLKKMPFGVPEGYFERFSDRLQARIRQEDERQMPVRRIGTSPRYRIAIAAALLGVVLISYSIIRLTLPNGGSSGSYPDIALLEELQVFDDDSYLMEMMRSGSDELDEEEAFATQAMDYLAINDVEIALLFE